MDFVILDVDDDVDVPLILGSPFLATSQTLIDVSNGKITIRVGDEEVVLALSDTMKHKPWPLIPMIHDFIWMLLISLLMNVCRN